MLMGYDSFNRRLSETALFKSILVFMDLIRRVNSTTLANGLELQELVEIIISDYCRLLLVLSSGAHLNR